MVVQFEKIYLEYNKDRKKLNFMVSKESVLPFPLWCRACTLRSAVSSQQWRPIIRQFINNAARRATCDEDKKALFGDLRVNTALVCSRGENQIFHAPLALYIAYFLLYRWDCVMFHIISCRVHPTNNPTRNKYVNHARAAPFFFLISNI
jgi:hypothetical protein